MIDTTTTAWTTTTTTTSTTTSTTTTAEISTVEISSTMALITIENGNNLATNSPPGTCHQTILISTTVELIGKIKTATDDHEAHTKGVMKKLG